MFAFAIIALIDYGIIVHVAAALCDQPRLHRNLAILIGGCVVAFAIGHQTL